MDILVCHSTVLSTNTALHGPGCPEREEGGGEGEMKGGKGGGEGEMKGEREIIRCHVTAQHVLTGLVT